MIERLADTLNTMTERLAASAGYAVGTIVRILDNLLRPGAWRRTQDRLDYMYDTERFRYNVANWQGSVIPYATASDLAQM